MSAECADRPLVGRRIVVTRARRQAGSLVSGLEALGAEVVSLPLIEVAAPLDDGAAIKAAGRAVHRYDWVMVTSANGARALLDVLPAGGVPEGVRVGAVGTATASMLERGGVTVAVIPDLSTGAHLAEAVPDPPPMGGRILAVQAARARPELVDRLRAMGWSVEPVIAYRTITPVHPPELLEQVATADAVTFTASSTVQRFLSVAGAERMPDTVVCIGPVTATTAREAGLEVSLVADPHTVEGLVDAVSRALLSPPAGGPR
ncbi:MAG: uroporphyrinogen-III synthase [Actinomycetia bacterium]|nr:uroporphyrinogen-III synthase [Actinomycetes bacterium]